MTLAVQVERAEKRAITQAYGEAAYAGGLRIDKNGRLNTGVPADPQALAVYRRRSVLPAWVALVLTLVTADWLLRRYYGVGYNDEQPVIDPVKVRRWAARWLPGRRDE